MDQTLSIGLGVIRWAADKLALALLAATLTSTAACASADVPPMESDYPVAVMSVPMDFTQIIYWVDDHTVIFVARIQSDALESASLVPASPRRGGFNIYTWNVDTGAVEMYASLPGGMSGSFCFNYGTGQTWRAYDVLETEAGSVRLIMAGQFGRETPLPEAPQIAGKVRTNSQYCQVYNIDTPLPRSRGRRIIRLQERHGYMQLPPEVGPFLGIPEKLRHKTMIYHPAQGEPVTIPLDNLGRKLVSWVPFKGAYFIIGPNINGAVGKAERRRSPCRWALWLWPDGRYEELCYPWARWSERMDRVFPTAVGLVAPLKPPGTAKIESWRWPYLISGSTVTRLLSGGLGTGNHLAVSPNGCRLVFGFRYTSHRKVKGQGRDLRAIDLCRKDQ